MDTLPSQSCKPWVVPLVKVLMGEFSAGDRPEETRRVKPKALQLLHGYRRPPRGIADYHHLGAIPSELLSSRSHKATDQQTQGHRRRSRRICDLARRRCRPERWRRRLTRWGSGSGRPVRPSTASAAASKGTTSSTSRFQGIAHL